MSSSLLPALASAGATTIIMPTRPDNNNDFVSSTSVPSCPPEDEIRTRWLQITLDEGVTDYRIHAAQEPTPPPQDSQLTGSTDSYISAQGEHKQVDADDDNAVADMLSPISAEGDKQDERELSSLTGSDPGSPSEGYDFSTVRVNDTTSNSHLRCISNSLRSFPGPRLAFCAQAVDFTVLNNLSDKYMMSRWRSSTWTCESLSCAAI